MKQIYMLKLSFSFEIIKHLLLRCGVLAKKTTQIYCISEAVSSEKKLRSKKEPEKFLFPFKNTNMPKIRLIVDNTWAV